MISQKNRITVLYIKNKKSNWTPISAQTRKIREKTNEKIRMLGKKYYEIKNIFDRLKLKRDDIYTISKQFEKEYKPIKNNIHLQNQSRRIKEALICWYAEHFYDEIVQPNSAFLKRIIDETRNITPIKTTFLSNFENRTNQRVKENKRKPQIKKNSKVSDTQNQTNFQNFKINQEIDTIAFSNILNDKSFGNNTVSNSDNDCFNFEKLFNF